MSDKNKVPVAAKIDAKLWQRFRVEAVKRDVKIKDWWHAVLKAGLDALGGKK